MSSQVSARKALKDARQGKKFCFRSDHSEGFFNDLSMLFSLVGPLVTLAMVCHQAQAPIPRVHQLSSPQCGSVSATSSVGGVRWVSWWELQIIPDTLQPDCVMIMMREGRIDPNVCVKNDLFVVNNDTLHITHS